MEVKKASSLIHAWGRGLNRGDVVIDKTARRGPMLVAMSTTNPGYLVLVRLASGDIHTLYYDKEYILCRASLTWSEKNG